MSDNVNQPKWYTQGSIEPVDFLEASPHLGHHECNAIQYIYRYKVKNGIEDLEKAVWWINRLIALERRKLAEKHPPIQRHVPRHPSISS